MFANRYTALIDACSLASIWRRNLLLTLAEAEFFRVRWSQTILDETNAALVKMFIKKEKDDPAESADRAIAAMLRSFPEALVEDYDALRTTKFGLPDVNDEHVVAAALKTQAQTIVTENICDFPKDILEGLNLEVRTADDFIADTIALDEGLAIAAIKVMRMRMNNPKMEPPDLLRSMEAHGLLETASMLSSHIKSL